MDCLDVLGAVVSPSTSHPLGGRYTSSAACKLLGSPDIASMGVHRHGWPARLSIGISASTIPAQRRRNRASRACAFTWRTATDRPLRCRRRPAHANTGHGGKSPNGWWNAFQKSNQPWLGLTTAFRFLCGISTSTTCCTTGLHFSTIFSGTGRRMMTSITSNPYAMALVATVQLDAATPVGGESQKRGLGRNLCSTSTCRDRLQSPRMPACLGYGISAYVSPACTFGLSMAGTSRRDGRLWQKSIPRFGAGVSRGRIGMIISTTHFPFRNGCAAPTLTVRSRVSWLPLWPLQNSKQRTLRAGY